jgi:YkoY family integral membrane protein
LLHQTFQPRDLILVLLLIVLEGLLSIDNALVLGLLARQLPEQSRKKALTYGLIGSFIFRLAAVGMAAWLLRIRLVKLLGGAYLLYVVIRHGFSGRKRSHGKVNPSRMPSFWPVVISIELTDIAFAADSILASIALVGPVPAGMSIHPKLWVVLLGGMLGVVLMRFAAVLFIELLKRFPRFETSAYLLVGAVGLKLIADWWYNAVEIKLDFESPASPAFWVFWSVMAICVALGFLPGRRVSPPVQPV